MSKSRRRHRRYYGPLSVRRLFRHPVPWPVRWLTGLCVAGAVLTACGGTAPSAAACKSALSQQVTYSEAHPGTGASMTEPATCKGLPAATYRQIAVQVVDQALKQAKF